MIIVFIITRYIIFDPSFPVSSQETYFSVLGIKMNEGYFLYKDFTENIAPLSAVVYWSLEYFWNQDFLIYHIIAAIITLYQVLYFTYFFNRLQIFPEQNFIPAFLFILFSSLNFEFFSLSPQLMGSTFLLFAISHVYQLILKGDSPDEAYKIGLFCGIASLFYFPFLIFSVVVILSLALFSNVPLKKYFILALGLLFPLLMSWLLFVYFDAGKDFFAKGVFFSFSLNKIFNFYFKDFLLLFSIGFLITLIGFFKAVNSPDLIYYQQRCRIIVFFWVSAGILAEITSFEINYISFWILVFPMAYYSFFFFQYVKKWWMRYSIYLMFLCSVFLGIIGYKYGVLQHDFKNDKIPTFGKIMLISSKLPIYQNKDNHPVIGFVNLKLTYNLLNNLDDPHIVLKTYLQMKRELPKYIIDEQMVLSKKLFKAIPQLSKMYEYKGNGVYRRCR